MCSNLNTPSFVYKMQTQTPVQTNSDGYDHLRGYAQVLNILGMMPAGYSLNIDDYLTINTHNLYITCPKGHKNEHPSTWNAIKKRIGNGVDICYKCSGKPEQRPKRVIYNDLVAICGNKGIDVTTPFDKFGGRKSRVSVKCIAHSHVQDEVLVESLLEYRSNGCSKCTYGKNKSGTLYNKTTASCECELNDPKTCLGCSLAVGMTYMKHTVSQYKDEGVDYEWIVDQYIKQEGKCFYSGIRLDTTNTAETCKMSKLSIDRCDNTKPHTQENCVLTTHSINVFKLDMTVDGMYALLDKIRSHATDEGYEDLSTVNKRYIKSKRDVGMMHNSQPSRREIKCEVSFPDLLAICKAAKNKCAISGCAVVWKPNQWNSGSFDRIDSDKGYTIDNIQVVLICINRLKLEMTTDQCRSVLKKLLYAD